MCYAGAGQGFIAADGEKYDNSCGGDAPPSGTPNWDKCYAEKKLEECPTILNIHELPGFDGEKWSEDPAWVVSFLNQQTAVKSSVTCHCKCGDVFDEVWPAGKTVCQSLTSTGDCSGDTCCGAGTIYKDGKCVASYEDIQNACKNGLWECMSFSDNSCN